jgi:Arginine methyltransferase oligomerization subdomain/Ribosomal protein L11 methyltransferase (PrmA)
MKMISFYHKLLAETSRLAIFQKSIDSVIRPGDAVCEIGTGLGTYAFMASRAGADRVYAIDDGPVIEIAKKLYGNNQKALGRIDFINQYSTLVVLPERVDAVIYENFDSLGLNIIQSTVLADARQRFLKPGGTFIPSGMNLFWAPLQARGIWEREVSCLEKDDHRVAGFDYRLMRELAPHERIQTQREADALLASPKILETVDFYEVQQLQFKREIMIDISVPGTLHGFGGWVDYIFPGGYEFSLSFERPVTTYARSFFPIPEPIDVEPGDRIFLNVSVMKKPLAAYYTWSWWGKICDQRERVKSEWKNSTFHLQPFQPQDLYLPKANSPDFRPVINTEGNIRKFILKSCNGEIPIEKIAGGLLKHFPEDISSLEQAMTKVLRVIKKCSI